MVTEQLKRFADCTFKPSDIVEIRVLPKAESVFIKAHELSSTNGRLTTQNKQGQNIYIGANPRTHTNGKDADAVKICRCLFCDLDNVSVEQAKQRIADLPTPTLCVMSGHGVWAFWRLTEPIDSETFTAYQKRLIATVKSDPSIHDTPRIVRLPGFRNHKAPAADAYIIHADPKLIYDLRDIEENLVVFQPQTPAKPTANHSGDLTAYCAVWPGVSEGKRGNEAYHHAAQLVKDHSKTEAEAMKYLSGWNNKNIPPLDEDELHRILLNAGKYGTHPPGEKLQSKADVKQDDSDPFEPILIDMSDVVPRKLKWLWQDRIPLGSLSLIAGNPGLGKSLIGVMMSAYVTQGKRWPDCPDAPNPIGSVIIMSGEDNLQDVLRPRIDAAGAKAEKIKSLTAIRELDEHGKPVRDVAFDIDLHATELIKAIKMTPDTRLVIIDPLACFIGQRIDTHRDASVRQVLGRLASIAEEHNIAIVCITHFNKGQGNNMGHRVIGSVAFNAAARAVWYVAKDPDDEDRRCFTPGKNNLAPEPSGLTFRLESTHGDIPSVKCVFENELDYRTADEILNHKDEPHRDSPRLNMAKDWLQETLSGGPMDSGSIKAMAEQNGIKAKTLYQAKRDLNISDKDTGRGESRKTVWTISERI